MVGTPLTISCSQIIEKIDYYFKGSTVNCCSQATASVPKYFLMMCLKYLLNKLTAGKPSFVGEANAARS